MARKPFCESTFILWLLLSLIFGGIYKAKHSQVTNTHNNGVDKCKSHLESLYPFSLNLLG